jgi:ADP-ribose pyrophosphatase YjhB (NUDIX family)
MKDWSVRIVVRILAGILLIRKPGGRWHLPGGKKEPHHENWRQTAGAELDEETGVKASNFLRITRHHNRRGKKGRYTLIYCEALIEDPSVRAQLKAFDPDREDGEEARIFSYEDVIAMTSEDLDPVTKRFLQKWKLLSARKPSKGNHRNHRRA